MPVNRNLKSKSKAQAIKKKVIENSKKIPVKTHGSVGTSSTSAKQKVPAKAKSKPVQKAKSKPQPKAQVQAQPKPVTTPKPKSKETKFGTLFNSTWVQDEDAKYKQYIPDQITPEMYEELTQDKRNTWAKGVENRQFKYDSKLLDPYYAAQVATKRGHKAFVGDINNDNVDDVVIVNKAKKIKAFNGHIPKKSKQEQLMRYYKEGGVKMGEDGEAKFGDKLDFKKWLEMTVANMDAAGTRAKINKELNKQGFASYKVKQKTFLETLKAQLKPFYDNTMNEFSNHIQVPLSDINKVMTYNKFASIYIRTILNGLYNINASTPANSFEGKIINKTLKRKWDANSGLADLSKLLMTAFGDIVTQSGTFPNSIELIYRGLMAGAPNEEIQNVLSQNLVSAIGNRFDNLISMATGAANIVMSEMNNDS